MASLFTGLHGSTHEMASVQANEDGKSNDSSNPTITINAPGELKQPTRFTNTANPESAVGLVYNEYGELVDRTEIGKVLRPQDMNALQVMRLFHKAYGRNIRRKIKEVILLQITGTSAFTNGPHAGRVVMFNNMLSQWDLDSTDFIDCSSSGSPGTTTHNALVYHGPPRVLNIGCDDGKWCIRAKETHPNWIVEGIDDADRWSKLSPHLDLKDFFGASPSPGSEDYFSSVHMNQKHAEFNVRNVNHLLSSENPIHKNLYTLVRGFMMFCDVENWAAFLDDVRQILKPGGVVEFAELDPRPRIHNVAQSKSELSNHTSRPATDWGDTIAERFKDPRDETLATMCPAWLERVEKRQEAMLRPQDGYPSESLKSRIQGSGFWDVKELVLRLPIGGASDSGKLLCDVLAEQIKDEDEYKLVRSYEYYKLSTNRAAPSIPAKVDPHDLTSGEYFLNLHICSGRKPLEVRQGDLLSDGTRKEMSTARYNAMARTNHAASNQWKRFSLDDSLGTMMKNITNLQGGTQWKPISSASSVASSISSSVESRPVSTPDHDETIPHLALNDTATRMTSHGSLAPQSTAGRRGRLRASTLSTRQCASDNISSGASEGNPDTAVSRRRSNSFSGKL